MYDENFNNIQTLIKVNKTLTSPKTGKKTFYTKQINKVYISPSTFILQPYTLICLIKNNVINKM